MIRAYSATISYCMGLIASNGRNVHYHLQREWNILGTYQYLPVVLTGFLLSPLKDARFQVLEAIECHVLILL
jgi:hypothetical protein